MMSARHCTLSAETGTIAKPISTQSNRVTAKMSDAAFRNGCREFIVKQLSLLPRIAVCDARHAAPIRRTTARMVIVLLLADAEV